MPSCYPCNFACVLFLIFLNLFPEKLFVWLLYLVFWLCYVFISFLLLVSYIYFFFSAIHSPYDLIHAVNSMHYFRKFKYNRTFVSSDKFKNVCMNPTLHKVGNTLSLPSCRKCITECQNGVNILKDNWQSKRMRSKTQIKRK